MTDEEQKTDAEGGKSTPAAPTQYALHLATVSGIPIRLHFTFLLLLAYFGLAGEGPGRWTGLLFIIMLFGCVVLHELGHSIVAQRYGIEVAEIVLYPIGGVARLLKLPKPRQELWIALAGPAVNIIIAALLYVILKSQGVLAPWDQVGSSGKNLMQLLQMLLGANIVLALFNMVPAFPMDGGRVLRAWLAMRMDEYRATQIAASVGQLLAFALGFAGLYTQNFMWLFIAFFVYIGAGQEAAMYQGKALVEGLPVREAMITEFHTLPVGTTLGEARETLLRTSQTDFPVAHGEQIVGLLSRNALLHGLAEEGPTGYVAGVMEREFPVARPEADLEEIASEMQAGRTGCVLVMEGDALLGMVTRENLAELLIVRQIMQRTKQRA
jgi:Zn-dependent protease/CBS domain-containing protein